MTLAGDPHSNGAHPSLAPVHPAPPSHSPVIPPVQPGASSHQAANNANIDLGAVYQQTVENRVTKYVSRSVADLFLMIFTFRSFTQHWIVVGRHLRVLLLDFDGKFTLLIPNIEMGKAFRINKAEVEVQTRDLEGGHKLTFMKFIFQSPQLEIKAPVLNDKAVGYQVLSQNGACVFLKRIFDLPSQGRGVQPQPQPQPQPQAQAQAQPFPNGGFPGVRSHVATVPSNFPPAGGFQAPARPQSHGMAASPYSQTPLASPAEPGYVNSLSPCTRPLTGLHTAEMMEPTVSHNSPQPAICKPPEEVKLEPPVNQIKSAQNFFELYKALSDDDYSKMTTCSYCHRKFRFTSVLIEHLATHTPSVEKIVEMKLKIWINGSKLKCTEVGCKKKFAYTLEYTRHRDNHQYEGLTCSVCGSSQSGPAVYAAHLKSEHPEHLTSTETHQDDLIPPPVKKSPSPTAPLPEAVLSPAVLCNPRTPGGSAELQLPQVHTPQSAPPVMTASPAHLSHLGPLSPQQPMSAPPTTQFSDDMDFASAINMPIIDEEALSQPDPHVINNKETEEFMSILNDLKDCTSTPPFPSGPSPTDTQTPGDMFPEDIVEPPAEPHPVILPQRETPEVFPVLPPRAQGVIKRNPSISEPQCYTPGHVASPSSPLTCYPPYLGQASESAQSTPAVRALVAQKILRRKSRSSSFDSNKSEPLSGNTEESLANMMMAQTSHNQNSVITSRQSAEFELENSSENQNKKCSFPGNFDIGVGVSDPQLQEGISMDENLQPSPLLNSNENYNGKKKI